MKNRSEASTFAGIPIPLTMETILDATQKAYYTYMHHYHGASHEKNKRQYHAFRTRILRMDAEKDKYIDFLHKNEKALHKRIAELEQLRTLYVNEVIQEQEQRIAELEAYFIGASTSTNKELTMDKPLSERLPEEIFNRVHQDIGEASTCWTDLDGAGTFESERASVISFNLCHYIADHLDIKDARIAELEEHNARLEKWVDDNAALVYIHSGYKGYKAKEDTDA